MHLYAQSVLLPNSAYRVPADTRYIFFSTQKNFFSLDIVSENFEIPFPFKDPIKNRISRIPGLYDRPPKTPYIEDEPTSNEMTECMPSSRNMPDMPSSSNMPDMPNCSNMPECMPSCSKMPDMPSPDNTDEKLSEINLYFVPNLPILETTVVLATPEFVTNFQKLSKCRKTNPNIAFYPRDSLELDQEPIDLSFKSIVTPNIENLNSNNEPLENFITNDETLEISKNNEHRENFNANNNPLANINANNNPLENDNANNDPLENVNANNEPFEISNTNNEISMNPILNQSPLNPENDFSDLMDFENIFNTPIDNDQFSKVIDELCFE